MWASIRRTNPELCSDIASWRIISRILGKRLFVESVTRSDIDHYKAVRSQDKPQQRKGERVSASTVNFEVSVLRTFFNFLIHERLVDMDNPCARFKPLRDASGKSNGRAPTYSQEEVERILGACDGQDRVAFATLLLTGLREQELCYLTWDDVKLGKGRATVLVRRKPGFTPKDYEEREIPVSEELAAMLRRLPGKTKWVFPNASGDWNRTSCGGLSEWRSRPGSPTQRCISYGTLTPHDSWRMARTSSRYSDCWGTAISTRRSGT